MKSTRTLNEPARCTLGIALLILAFAIVYSTMCGKSSSPHIELLETIPLGSRLSDLESVDNDPNVWGSSVIQWVIARTPPAKGQRILVQVGDRSLELTSRRNIGSFANVHNNTMQFSGTVTFFMGNSLQVNTALIFTYVDGSLVLKDWGYMPG
ncbi:MAG TPA: hypothetical protein PK911_05235 [Candidatus Saccharibacteria bacterium]|nr:hypothetical protein [Candidatus Saccharibacteria bacterium]